MSKITYTDKVALNDIASVADINKVTDDDMNEIKTSVNDLYDYTDGTTAFGDIEASSITINSIQLEVEQVNSW